MWKAFFGFWTDLFGFVTSELEEVNKQLDELNEELKSAADDRRIERQKAALARAAELQQINGEKHE